MKVGLKSTMCYINKCMDKSIDAISAEYNYMTGADITGNAVTRRMKSLKKAHSYQVKSSALWYTLGSVGIVAGKKLALFPGSELFLLGIWQNCNAIESRKAIKNLKPQYKEVVKRAKAIYG